MISFHAQELERDKILLLVGLWILCNDYVREGKALTFCSMENSITLDWELLQDENIPTVGHIFASYKGMISYCPVRMQIVNGAVPPTNIKKKLDDGLEIEIVFSLGDK